MKDESKTRSARDVAPRNTTVGVAANYDDALAFLQEVTLKTPRVLAVPLLLRADFCATSWFRQWAVKNLIQDIIQNTAPQDNSGLTGVLSEVATGL